MLFDWLCVIESHAFCNEIRYVPTVPKPNRVNDDWQTASLLAAANTHEVRVLPCSRLRQQSPEGSCYIRILSPQLNMARVISPIA